MKSSKIKKINISIFFGESQMNYSISKNNPYIITCNNDIVFGILGNDSVDKEIKKELKKIKKHWNKVLELNKKR